MMPGIITYAVRIEGRIKSRALFIMIDVPLDELTLETFLQDYLTSDEYLLAAGFAFIDAKTKARICAEG